MGTSLSLTPRRLVNRIKLTYGHAGLGTASHIPAEVMKTMTDTEILAVPYKGVAEATNDLIAGRIDIFFVGTQIAQQHVQSGRLRALAVTGAKRWKGMPDTPTLQELGLKDFNVVNWFGLWLPVNAPAAIVSRLQAEIVKAVAQPDVISQFDCWRLCKLLLFFLNFHVLYSQFFSDF